MDGLRSQLEQVMDTHEDVLVAYLFGSHARGTAGPLSDIDVAVLLSSDDQILARRLALIADVTQALSRDDVDVIVLNEAPVALAYRVLRDGVLVSCRDDLVRIRHRVRTVDRYLDMEPFRRVQAEGLRHRLEEGKFGRS